MCWNEQQDAGGCTGLDRLLLCLLCVHDNVPQAMVWGQSCPQSCPRSWHLFSWGRLARRAALRSPSLQVTKGQMTKHRGLLYCSYLCCFGVAYMLFHERESRNLKEMMPIEGMGVCLQQETMRGVLSVAGQADGRFSSEFLC